MDNATKKYVKKLLDDMNLIDDFLFNEIMADENKGEEVCRMILGCVLKRELAKIDFVSQKIIPGVSETSHGIRLDVYIREETGSGDCDLSIYDIEPDQRVKKKYMLPKRSRYYTDLMDIHLLEAGADYDKLPELVTIFILSYDPFGEGEMCYEVGNVIKNHPDIPYNDGIRRIFLYTDGRLTEGADEDERRLKNLLQYIKSSTEINITDDMTKRLDEIVRETKADKYVGVRFMKSWEWLHEAKEEAKEEAMEEGRKEGRKEGKEEERINTERERRRADAAELRVKELEAELAALKRS